MAEPNLTRHLRDRPIFLGLILSLVTLCACASMVAAGSFVRFRQGIIYPRARVLSTHQRTALPKILYQQGVMLRTTDDTPLIQAWYVDQFGFGREQIHDGQCSHMYGFEKLLFVERRMTLTICESLRDRAFYVAPTINPDGRAHWFDGPNTMHSSRGGKRPAGPGP